VQALREKGPRPPFSKELVEIGAPLVIIGLDGTPGPWLLRSLAEFPNLAQVFLQSWFGELRSCDPPITVPAWCSMLSGKDPGELGLYGFHARFGPAPQQRQLVHSGLLPDTMLWHYVQRRGAESLIMGVPPSYPPPHLSGCAVSCLLTPEGATNIAYPPSLADWIRQRAPAYRFDVADFRNRDPEETFDLLRMMAETRFRLARELLRERRFDLAILVEIGTDRVQHALWGLGAEPAEAECGPLVRAYYRFLDAEIGSLLEVLGEHVHLWLVSDHGAQSLRGGVFLNEWLIRNGYLRMRAEPRRPAPLRPEWVDWPNTVAWAEGGYVGRVFLNVRGRQPEGKVAPADMDRVREEIAHGLEASLVDGHGRRLPVETWRAEQRYREVRGLPPDLFVYVDGMAARAFGTVGTGQLWGSENDTGSDRANHHPLGFYAYRPPGGVQGGYAGERHLGDLFPLFLEQAGCARSNSRGSEASIVPLSLCPGSRLTHSAKG